MARSTRTSSSMMKQLIVVIVLLLLFAALAVSYYLLTRPPEVQGSDADRDRKFMFSIYGFEGDLLRRPTGVGVDDQGNIYVADTGKRRIAVFDANGNFIRVYGEAGKGELLIWDPIDVAVAPDGRSWVVDKTQSKIVEYDITGRAAREIATPELPLSITLTEENMFVTVESGVLIADLDGNLLTGYIKKGKDAGSFDRPGGVAVGADDTLYVADSLNYRVQAISSTGQPLWQYGAPLPADSAVQADPETRKFGLPSNITIDENNLLYVVDGLNSEIKVLDTEGELVEIIGDVGHEDGLFYYPDGIDYGDGRIVIADKFNDRVSVFRAPIPPGQQWRSFVPWAAALLLLPLLLLLVRRGRRYVVTPEFIPAITADEDRDEIAAAIKRVFADEALAQAGAAVEDPKLDWKATEPKAEDVQRIVERFAIAEGLAKPLAIALRMRGKRVLIVDDAATHAAAKELQVPVVTYAEIKAAFVEDTGEPSATDETQEAE